MFHNHNIRMVLLKMLHTLAGSTGPDIGYPSGDTVRGNSSSLPWSTQVVHQCRCGDVAGQTQYTVVLHSGSDRRREKTGLLLSFDHQLHSYITEVT